VTGPEPAATIVEVRLGAVLDAILGARLEKVSHEVALEVTAVIDSLGVPARAEVTVTAGSADADANGLLGVRVDGRRCRYPDELIRQVGEVVLGSYVIGGRQPNAIAEDVREKGEAAAVRLVAAACGEIVKLRASRLLGEAQATAYAEWLWATTELSRTDWPVDRLAAVLRPALDLWVPISDSARVASALESAGEDPSEDLIAALRPDRLDVEVRPELLRAMTETVDEEQVLTVPLVREQLYEELGLRFPACRFVPAGDLADLEIRFRINALRTAPVLGIPPGRVLVNETPDRLQYLDIQAAGTGNPANGMPASVADASHMDTLAAAGLTTWDTWEHLLLTLAATLRAHGHRLVDASVAQGELELVEAVFPALGRTARSVLTVVDLARIERALLRELVSVRDLRRILRAAIEWRDAAFTVQPRLRDAGDAEDRDLEAFVRAALARRLQQQHANAGTDTIVAYLLDPEIEALLLADAPLSEEDGDRIVEAVRNEVGGLPADAQLPVLLTTVRARAPVAAAISDAFPRLRVLAYEELVPRANVQPVERISLIG
jgi:hypothetical protein